MFKRESEEEDGVQGSGGVVNGMRAEGENRTVEEVKQRHLRLHSVNFLSSKEAARSERKRSRNTRGEAISRLGSTCWAPHVGPNKWAWIVLSPFLTVLHPFKIRKTKI